VTDSPDDRSPIAMAVAWTSRITTISVQMIAPGIVGYLVDRKLGTKALFTLIGFAIGMALGMWQLVRVAQSSNQNNLEKNGGELPGDDER
jgi:F0F1-type ATP synthase assembly protein I